MWQETPLKVCGNFKMTISFLAYSKEVPEDCSIVFFRCISGHFSMQFWWQKWVPSPSCHSFRSLQWTLSPRPACSDNHHYWNWKKIVKIFFYILYMHYLTSVRSRRLDIKEVLFCVFIDEDAVEVDKNAKKNRGQCTAILVNKGFIIWPKRELSLEEPTREIPSPSCPLG